MKKRNRRTKNIKNIKETASDLKNRFDWLKIKNQIIEQYSSKPAVFIGSAVATIFIFFLILSPSNEEPEFLTPIEKPIALTIPSTVPATMDTQISEVNENNQIVNAVEFADAPLNEVELINEEAKTHIDQGIEITEMSEPSLIKQTDDENFADIPTKTQNTVTRAPTTLSSKANTQSSAKTKRKAVKSWVFKKNPDHYTVQLISGANKKDILKFIDSNRKLKRLSYFQTIKNGKSWYVVVQSTYDSFAKANKMRKRLPKHIAKHDPWVRPYGSIQKEIVANAEKLILLNSSFASTD